VEVIREERIGLDKVGEESDGTAEMLYTGRLSRGICALYRAKRRQAIVLHFDTVMLPFLGLWICNGGWPDNPKKRKQHAVAMEPTVAPYGSLAEAITANAAPILEPDTEFTFSVQIEILGWHRPWSYDDVTRYVDQADYKIG
jgi:hypothetical protein